MAQSSSVSRDNIEFLKALLDALSRARTPCRLTAIIEPAIRELGFQHYALIEHGDLRVGTPDILCIENYPAA